MQLGFHLFFFHWSESILYNIRKFIKAVYSICHPKFEVIQCLQIKLIWFISIEPKNFIAFFSLSSRCMEFL